MNGREIFLDMPNVNLLEKEEKWHEACKLLYEIWKEEPNNLQKTIRLLWECWYLNVEDLCFVNFTEEESDDVRGMFREAYRYGEEHFGGDGIYRWITGFMLSIDGSLMYDITVYQENFKIPGIHIFDLEDQEAEYRQVSAIGIMPDEIMRWTKYYEANDAAAEREVKRIRKLFKKKRLTADEKEEKKRIEKKMEEVNRKVKEYFPSDSLIDEYYRESYTMTYPDYIY